MDDALRTSLWNTVQDAVWSQHSTVSIHPYTQNSNLYGIVKLYWRDFFKEPTNDIPTYIYDTVEDVKRRFFAFKWFMVYDFVEFTASILSEQQKAYVDTCNFVLEREKAGYRLIGTQVTPITSSEEIDAIEGAIDATTGIPAARTHLVHALQLLSDRQAPDYRNSIKESISAVEAVVQAVTGESSATLGAALKAVSTKAMMHPALNKSLSSLYGYTSDADGIRHALLEASNLDFVDAKFMLSSCAAFVNYLVGKAAQNGR